LPVYEYDCLDCSLRYERREGFDAPSRQQCPRCGGTARRVFHAPPILFKGSGFYVTDSRKGSNGSSERLPEPAGAEAADSRGSEASSD
jgi:putative FmdB family regulatory protein